MKKDTLFNAITIFMVILASVLITKCTIEQRTYAKNTIVKEVDYTNNIVTCVDFNGYEWQFEGCEDWQEGDYCTMVMYDRGTLAIKDDKILSTTYTGYTENGEF